MFFFYRYIMPEYFDAREIVPRVWIGSKKDALSDDFMRRHSIGMIVNCTEDIDAPFSGTILSMRIPVHDNPAYNDIFSQHVSHVVSRMHMFLRHTTGKNILVHCFAGISRSASLVAAFLMSEYRISMIDAIRFIQSRKPETFGAGVNFVPMLQNIEKIVMKQKHVIELRE